MAGAARSPRTFVYGAVDNIARDSLRALRDPMNSGKPRCNPNN